MQKDLTEVKIFQKVLGGSFLKHPVLVHLYSSYLCFDAPLGFNLRGKFTPKITMLTIFGVLRPRLHV